MIGNSVFERIRDVDSDFIRHIEDLFREPYEERSRRRIREECPGECEVGTKGIEWPRDIWNSDGTHEENDIWKSDGIYSDNKYKEREESIETIEDRIWDRQEGTDPLTILGRNIFRWPWTNNSPIKGQDPATVLRRSVVNREGNNNSKSSYVLYPYGTGTGDYPSRFLGICIGDTPLEDVMKAALEHSAIVANKFRWNDSELKTVVIITDKWNQNRFNRAYEGQMLAHAVNDGIFYLFLLVNQFGIEQIPFLPNDRSSICRVTWNNLPEKVRKTYTKRVLESGTVFFKKTDYDTGQTKTYVINNIKVWQTLDGSEKGMIEKSKIGNFIDVCYNWADNSFMGDSPFSEDFKKFENGLDIFGKSIYLDWFLHKRTLKNLEKLLGQ